MPIIIDHSPARAAGELAQQAGRGDRREREFAMRSRAQQIAQQAQAQQFDQQMAMQQAERQAQQFQQQQAMQQQNQLLDVAQMQRQQTQFQQNQELAERELEARERQQQMQDAMERFRQAQMNERQDDLLGHYRQTAEAKREGDLQQEQAKQFSEIVQSGLDWARDAMTHTRDKRERDAVLQRAEQAIMGLANVPETQKRAAVAHMYASSIPGVSLPAEALQVQVPAPGPAQEAQQELDMLASRYPQLASELIGQLENMIRAGQITSEQAKAMYAQQMRLQSASLVSNARRVQR